MYGEEINFLVPTVIHNPDGTTNKISWEKKRRILNLWMETNGFDWSTARASACKQYKNNEILHLPIPN
jgi:hypothetical protein